MQDEKDLELLKAMTEEDSSRMEDEKIRSHIKTCLIIGLAPNETNRNAANQLGKFFQRQLESNDQSKKFDRNFIFNIATCIAAILQVIIGYSTYQITGGAKEIVSSTKAMLGMLESRNGRYSASEQRPKIPTANVNEPGGFDTNGLNSGIKASGKTKMYDIKPASKDD